MTQPPDEDCFKITAPLIEQPFKSKLHWGRSLLVAADGCPRKELASEESKQCQIQRCTDAAFIKTLRGREPQSTIAWNKLYELYGEDLYAWLVFKGCKDEAIAQSIVHDVLLQLRDLIHKKGLVLESATLKTYLFRSAFHKWMDHLKKPGTKKEFLPGELPEPEPEQDSSHVFEKIRQFIKLYRKAFSDPEDNCLKLMKYAYLEKMPYKEMLATKVGQQYKSEKTIGERVRKCTASTMARMMEEEFKKEFEDIFGQYRINLKRTGGEYGKA